MSGLNLTLRKFVISSCCLTTKPQSKYSIGNQACRDHKEGAENTGWIALNTEHGSHDTTSQLTDDKMQETAEDTSQWRELVVTSNDWNQLHEDYTNWCKNSEMVMIKYCSMTHRSHRYIYVQRAYLLASAYDGGMSSLHVSSLSLSVTT